MKTCRKSVATVLLLLIHLLTLQIDDAVAGRNSANASDVKRDPRIILEEVIITGSGNNTRVTANAVAEEPLKIGEEIISLLSKRNARRRRRLKQTSSDQDADQSRAVTVNAEDDEDLERLKRVIAKYEPQRITSRKTKRKIVDGPNGTHDVHDKAVRSSTDFEKIYQEVLRNISRRAPELMVSNVNVTLIPYLSQVIKNLGQTHIPEATIRPASDEGATKTLRSDVDTSPTTKNKKKNIFKKYLQLNRTTASPRISSIEEIDKEIADDNKSGTANFKLGGRTKNESLFSSESAEKPESPRKWNAQESSAHIKLPFNAQLNDSNVYNVFNTKNSNVPSDANSLYLLSKYNVTPRPFSILQSPDASVATNLNILYRKPSVSPVGFNHQQLVRSSANILPLVLPTELFSPPPARYYIPIKRTNYINAGGSPATIVSTEANPPANVVKGRTVFDKPSVDYSASYADVIGTTKSPLIVVNGPRSSGSSDYYAVTENPAETVHVPSQTPASYTLQRQKDPQTVIKNEFLPKIATYNSPEKSDLNANLELALYNKFARLYSVDPNLFNMPKIIVQDYQDKQPETTQQVSTLPYASLKPISPTLLKVQPAKPALAPYYESRLFISQDGKELNNKDNEESVKMNEQSRAKNVDETEGEAADDKDNFTNYKTRIDHGASKTRVTPDEQREKEDREETEKGDYHTRDYEHQDKYSKDNKNDKINDEREKYENIRHENDKDEEDVDETHEDEHVSAGEDEHDQDYRHSYNKYEYDRDDSEEQRDDKSEKKDNKSEQGYEKRNKENDDRDKHYDYEADFKYGLEGSNKYSDSRYNDDKTREDEGHSKFYGDKKSDNSRPKKNRQDRKHEDSEEKNVAEGKLYTQRSEERVYGQRKKNEKKHNKGDDTTYKRKYRPQTVPRKDSRPEEYKHGEYSEINPKHVRKEYHNQQQHIKNNQRGHRKYDSENQNGDNEKLPDHVHGETKEHAHKHEEHHEKKKDGGNHKFEEGESEEHEEDHHKQEGEEGKKGYKVWHEHEKAEKGHHDKEHASKEYDEKNGEKKNHEEEGGYHEHHHHGEEGKKTAEFGEKGEHKKGHSTHGEHSVHKKDEYEKKTEFFDEFHEDDGIEKHGEHHHQHESKKGGHEKKAHHDAADHEAKHGKEEKYEKGGHHHEHKGHKADEGHDHHYDHQQKHGKKEGHEHGKKWSYKEGDDGGNAGGDHKHNR